MSCAQPTPMVDSNLINDDVLLSLDFAELILSPSYLVRGVDMCRDDDGLSPANTIVTTSMPNRRATYIPYMHNGLWRGLTRSPSSSMHGHPSKPTSLNFEILPVGGL